MFRFRTLTINIPAIPRQSCFGKLIAAMEPSLALLAGGILSTGVSKDMKFKHLMIAATVLTFGATAPALATFGSASGWSSGASNSHTNSAGQHVHGPGCGHPGYGGSTSTSGGSTSGGSTGSTSGGSTGSTSGGSSSFGGSTSGGSTGSTSGGSTGSTSGGSTGSTSGGSSSFGGSTSGGSTGSTSGGSTGSTSGGSTGSTSGGTSVPEPSDFALFLLGVTGLVIGRRASSARKVRAQAELDG
jgi:hypothetical protein